LESETNGSIGQMRT